MMTRQIRRAVLAMLPALLVGACEDSTGPDDDVTVLAYDFATSTHGWTAGFADYPVGGDEDYELATGHTALPAPLDGARRGMYVAGNNHSDDLLMFLKRQVDGLAPNTTYRVRFEIEIATNAPRGCVGTGGAAGESVYVKAGAAPTEPQRIADDQDHWRLSVDIGNQAADGEQGITIGDVATTNTDCTAPVYQLKRVDSGPKVLQVRTDGQGALWLIVGIDSGFESLTRLWYTRVEVRLTPTTAS